jgi:hypothetical protein
MDLPLAGTGARHVPSRAPLNRYHQFGLVLTQKIYEGAKPNHSCRFNDLVRLPEHFEMNEVSPQFGNLQVAILDFPDLPALQGSEPLVSLKLHCIRTDNQNRCVVSKNLITFL